MKRSLLLPIVALAATPAIGGPNLNAPRVPSAFVAQHGDLYAWSAAWGYDEIDWSLERGKYRAGVDSGGAVGGGFGLGDAGRLVALEIGAGVDVEGSGGLDVRLGRDLVSRPDFRLAAGGGVLNAVAWGTADHNASAYGVITGAGAVGNMPLQISAGYANGGDRGRGLVGGVGLGITPEVGVSIGYSRGVTAGLSYSPKGSSWAFGINAGNLGDEGGRGRSIAATVAWGGSFRSFAPTAIPAKQ